MESELRQVVGQAARAGAHFYTIDVRGLNKGGNAQIIDHPLASNPMGAMTGFDMQADGTNSLAIDTGGFAIRNENNFGRALDEIQRDAGTYYVVAYMPSNAVFDGKYRTIEVRVSRPGVKVRARRGYLALPPASLITGTAAAPAKPRGDASPTPAAAPPLAPPSTRLDPIDSLRALGREVAEVGGGRPEVGGGRPEPGGGTPPTAAARLRPDARFGETGSAPNAAAERGWAAYERGDLETAARELGDAAKAPDARPWVAYALGLSQFGLRQAKEAAQSWERVRRDAPEFEPVYFSLADAYALQREDGSALKVLRDAEARWPQDSEVANAIGVIHVRRGALDAALESFTRATKIAPADALGYFNLARTYQMRLVKSQRYDRQSEKWIGGDEDRRRATENFEKYLTLGGPYERQAREALAALSWK
jgi:tetratricopeptide (TPR) repeat protein